MTIEQRAVSARGPSRWSWAVGMVAVVAGMMAAASPVTAEASAEPATESCEGCLRIDAIVVDGLLRTKRSVVERELLFEEGDTTTIEEVEESIQRLRNTQLFRRVDWEFDDHTIGAFGDHDHLLDDGLDSGALRLTVDERYTVSPSFRFGQGGNTLQLRLGLQDVNLGGSFLQGGVTYSRLGSANSMQLWFRDPRFLDRRQEVTLRGAYNNRLYTLYDEAGHIDGGFLRTRRSTSLQLSREWVPWARTGIKTSFAADTFSYDMVGDAAQNAQQERGGLQEAMQTVTIGVSGQLGRINRRQHVLSGTTLRTVAEQHFHFGTTHPRSRRIRTTFRDYRPLPLSATLATRAELGFRTSEPTHMQFFAGGLGILRGTVNNRHRGAHHWFTNVELRVPIVDNNWVILEPVAFVDAVNVADIPRDIADVTALTTGGGLRIISKDFHGIIIRVDYAPPILGADGPGLSVGAGQFF